MQKDPWFRVPKLYVVITAVIRHFPVSMTALNPASTSVRSRSLGFLAHAQLFFQLCKVEDLNGQCTYSGISRKDRQNVHQGRPGS